LAKMASLAVTATPSKILRLPPPLPPEPKPARSERPAILFGSLDVVSAFDLLEWLCCNHKSWALRVLAPGLEGQAVVLGGELVDARFGSMRGLPALAEIVGCRQGQFDLVPVTEVAQPTLHGRWQALLLSAAQMLDERDQAIRAEVTIVPERRPAKAGAPQRPGPPLVALPSADARRSKPPPLPAGRGELPAPRTDVEALIDQGFAALREGDRAEARRCWGAALALAPGHRTLQFNLRKLESDGQRKPAAQEPDHHRGEPKPAR
jgi:hypothetical protein